MTTGVGRRSGAGGAQRWAGLIGSAAVAAAALAALPGHAAAPGAFDCLVEPSQVVEVRSPVAGLIQTIHVRRGETVSAGQLLVTIDSGVEQSAVDAARYRAQAQGALQLARRKVEAAQEKTRRMAELQREQFVSDQARDDAIAELKLAEAELTSAKEASDLAQLEYRQSEEQLKRRFLRSAFDGVVVDQYLHPGALVDAAEGKKPILKIAQVRPLTVQALLPFRLFKQIRPGRNVIVTPEAPFGGNINATVHSVDGVIDSAAGLFGVTVRLPNARNELPAGIRCKLRVPGVAGDAPE